MFPSNIILPLSDQHLYNVSGVFVLKWSTPLADSHLK